MRLFKGYIKTKKKVSDEKIKGRTEFKTLEQVQGLNEYAGVLGEESILLDIDDFEQSEILFKIVQDLKLKCRVYETTRGKHFLFKNEGVKNNATKCTLGIGLYADIKLGSKNSYEVLKFEGIDRAILYDTAENEIQDVPKCLTPVKTKMDFLNMDAGDGRNQALFNYILTLQSADFTVEEARETIRIINQYVLKDPLSEKELEVILRDEAFQKQVFFKGATFLFDKFAMFMKNNNRIIKVNNQLHLYRDGIYVPDVETIESEMVKHISNLNRSKRAEVFSYLRLICENRTPSPANLIAFNNGVYDISTDEFGGFSPEYIITNKIDWDFNPEAFSELADDTLNKIACNDVQIRMLLEEVIGSCMYRSNTLAGGKAFILIGEKNNGKSTFLDMVKTMLGENNISSLELKELNEKFQNAELFGKLANIGDDIDSEYVPATSFFKKLVTGERVQVQRKGERPFEFNNYSKLLFSANNIPRLGKGKDTGAILRRLIIIPFNAKFSADDEDYRPNIKYDLRKAEVMEYLIQIGLLGLKRVLQNKVYSKSEKVESELQEYEVTNNPILGFIQESEMEEFQIKNEATSKVFEYYREYCLRNGYVPLAHNEFSKQIIRLKNYQTTRRTINGVKYTIFIEDDK